MFHICSGLLKQDSDNAKQDFKQTKQDLWIENGTKNVKVSVIADILNFTKNNKNDIMFLRRRMFE